MMRATPLGTSIVALALSILVLSILAMPMTAQADQPVAFGLTPVDQSTGYFTLTMNPGETRSVSVDLKNGAAQPLTAHIYPADVFTIVNGGFGAQAMGSPTTGVTKWLDFPTADLPLAPLEMQRHDFRVTVPEGTAPGEYITSVVAENQVGAEDGTPAGIHQNIRTAIAVSIRVPGDLTPELTVGDARYTLTGDRPTVHIALANDGSAMLKPTAKIIIRSSGDTVVWKKTIAMDSFYTHTTATLETTPSKPFGPDDYTVSITMTDAAAELTPVKTTAAFTVEGIRHRAPFMAKPTAFVESSDTAASWIAGSSAVLVFLVFAGVVAISFRRRSVPKDTSSGDGS